MTERQTAGEADAGGGRLRIGFVLARDFTLSAFSLFVDTLRLASDVGDRSGRINCDWEVVSASGHMIRASCGVAVAPTAPLGDPGRFSHIAVVGGLLRHTAALDDAALAFLKRAAATVPLIGVCTGSFILARAGLLRGRRACVSWYHFQEFRTEFPDVPAIADRLFLVDGNRITCAGGVGSADLAAHLVERRLGANLKEKAIQVLQIERARDAAAPQPRKPLGIDGDDHRVRRALLIMEQSIARPLPIAALARRVGVSSRQLERLFLDSVGDSPRRVFARIRLDSAKWLLQTSGRSMVEIALATGFSSASQFSRNFAKSFGMSPSGWRAAAAGGPDQTEGSKQGSGNPGTSTRMAKMPPACG